MKNTQIHFLSRYLHVCRGYFYRLHFTLYIRSQDIKSECTIKSINIIINIKAINHFCVSLLYVRCVTFSTVCDDVLKRFSSLLFFFCIKNNNINNHEEETYYLQCLYLHHASNNKELKCCDDVCMTFFCLLVYTYTIKKENTFSRIEEIRKKNIAQLSEIEV